MFEEALEGQLLGLSGNQLAELMWALAQLQHTPPAPLLQGILARVSCAVGCCACALACMRCMPACAWQPHARIRARLTTLPPATHHPAPLWTLQSQARMASGSMTGRDAAACLAALARLRFTPDEPWLHACLNSIYWQLRALEPDAFAGVLVSLSQLQVTVTGGDWLDNYISLSTSRLSAMQVDSQVRGCCSDRQKIAGRALAVGRWPAAAALQASARRPWHCRACCA